MTPVVWLLSSNKCLYISTLSASLLHKYGEERHCSTVRYSCQHNLPYCLVEGLLKSINFYVLFVINKTCATGVFPWSPLVLGYMPTLFSSNSSDISHIQYMYSKRATELLWELPLHCITLQISHGLWIYCIAVQVSCAFLRTCMLIIHRNVPIPKTSQGWLIDLQTTREI